MPTDFTLPELGENISSGDVLRILVKPGDSLAKDQPVLEIETDKATIEVPASVSGIVKDIKVKPGDKVAVGQAILSVESEDAPAPKAADAKPAPNAKAAQRRLPIESRARRKPSAAEGRAGAQGRVRLKTRSQGTPCLPNLPDPSAAIPTPVDYDAGGPVTSGEGARRARPQRREISRGARTTPEFAGSAATRPGRPVRPADGASWVWTSTMCLAAGPTDALVDDVKAA